MSLEPSRRASIVVAAVVEVADAAASERPEVVGEPSMDEDGPRHR